MKVGKREVIFFASGSLLGGGLGVLISWRHFKKKCDKRIEELLDSFNEEAKAVESAAYESAKKMMTEENYNYTEDDEDVISVDAYRRLYMPRREDLSDKTGENTSEGEKTLYGDSTALESPPEGGEYDDIPDPDEEKLISSDETYREYYQNQKEYEKSGKKPRFISGDDFYNSYAGFDECHLTYYTGDDVLIDESSDEELFDYVYHIGNALDKYGFRTNEEQVIYVLNYSTSTKYEISKCVGNWYDDV